MCSVISLTVLVTLILIACSLSVLSYNEVGLNYSAWFKTIEDKTYAHGIQFIGLGHSFQRYDIKVNTIEFSRAPDATMPMIKCRTKDGLELDLEISLQYRVDPEQIFKIYMTYGNDEKAILTRIVLDVVSDTATGYTSNDFFTKRSIIQQAIFSDLQTKVLELTWHEVVFFQLRGLSLPASYEHEIETTEVKGQDILKAQAEQHRDYVYFNTTVAVETLRVNATLEAAHGNADKLRYEGQSYWSTIGNVTQLQADAIAEMQRTLSFSSADIVQYLRTNLLRDYGTGKVAI